MNGKQLKNSILQWAIQGKLVPQDPNDEPSSVLLDKIRKEKERLIKEKKIKRDKNASIIFRGDDNSYYEKITATGEVRCIDEEIPFEVPSSWCWCRLRDVCTKFSTGPFGTMVHKSDYADDGIPLVNPTNIKEQQIFADNICKVSRLKYKELSTYVLSENDVILARRGDLSKCAVVNNRQVGWLAGTGSFFLHMLDLSLDFFIMLYTSVYAQTYLIGDSVGTTMNNLNQGLLSKMLIPIPPLHEQSRIVTQYRLVIPFVERYTIVHSERTLLDIDLPLRIKKSILQEAIQGKLVPQKAEEGTAQDLLEQIKEEKQKLVKEGKLKKSALNDSVIFKGDDNKYWEKVNGELICIDDEIPFDLPQMWCWCRLRSISSIKGGKRVPVGEKLILQDTGHKYIRVADMKNHTVKDTDIHYISDSVYAKIKAYTISSKDLYITVAGTIGCVGEIPEAFNNANLTENADKIVICKTNKKYLMYCLLSNSVQSQIKNCTTKVGQPKLAIIRIENLLIPLPPLKEQERIIAQIEKLFEQLH